jgi:hypothetical protein
MESGYNQFCPIAKASEVLAQRWTPLILRELMADIRTFNDLHALWRDKVGKTLFIEGDQHLTQSLPGWIRLDKVVGRDFPVVRPAA